MKIVLSFFILFSVISLQAQQSLAGVWNTGKDNTKVEMTEDNGVYSGKIISSENANAKIGNQLIKDVKSVDEEWKGKFYAPKKGKWFDAVFVEKDGQLMVTVGAGMRSKTITWSKE